LSKAPYREKVAFSYRKGMNTTKLLSVACTAVLLSGLSATAQGEFPFTFRGKCSQTDASGKIVSSPITDRDWLNQIASKAGITDLNSVKIVYHVNGNAMGDTIDVINSQNGVVLDTIFGLYFSQDYGRKAISNSKGDRRIQYIYTSQNTRSLGTALVSKNYLTDKKGNSSTTISGQMSYLVTPDGSNPNLKLCTGTFTVGKEIVFASSP
jgi:hypothetical protein